jgi:HEAT repeat protein
MNDRPHLASLIALACLLTSPIARAQDSAPTAPPVPAVATPAENSERAWALLTNTVTDTKHVDTCIQALAALGTMGSNDRAAGFIITALKDPERDIRTAAILAAGQTKNPRLTPNLRAALDDVEPEVAFAAATTLWKMHDHSGEDILVAVANGDRRGNATLMNGAKHTMSRDMHSPATLAKIGAMQGAAILLGPFGFGISAVEYARKNGADSVRGSAIDLLAEEHTTAIHSTLIDALGDKDQAVRAAAAKALGQWPDAATASALAPLIDDPKLPVRLTAAAAYLRVSTGHRTTKAAPKKP